VSIVDSPTHAWRGMHLDVSRHFFPLAEIRKLVDAMALHRLNVLHLHLTDDQGWRVEIKGYPKLTEVGAWRPRTMVGHMVEDQEDFTFDDVPHGGFYTQDELRELVTFAQDRGVLIVPEVDLPGHMQAAIAAYPHLGNNPDVQLGVREVWGISDHVLGVSDEAFAFVRDVLVQICEIFPAPFVHIGGDECPRVEWEDSDAVRVRMEEWGLTRVSEVQGKYTQFAFDVLAEQGRSVVAWDEVLESHLPDDVVVMNWRSADGVGEATGRGFRTVVSTCKYTYLDYYQGSPRKEPLAIGGHVSLKDVYTAELVPADLPDASRDLVQGIQGQLWTEYMPTAEHLEYMAFPRMCAIAERAWGSPEQSFSAFEERLREHLPRLTALGVNHRPLD
jgi:hexosaminidase